MSVVVKIFANHNLTIGNDYRSIIREIEERLSSKIHESREVAQDQRVNKQTLPEDVIFHTAHRFHEMKLSEGWYPRIETNSAFCERLHIFKHFLEFDFSLMINPKTHIWRRIVARDFRYWALDDWNEDNFNRVLEEWTAAKAYFASITKALGGNTFIYLNDGEMSIGWDLIRDGNSLSQLLKVLPKERPMYAYEDLEKNKTDFTDADWFYERI